MIKYKPNPYLDKLDKIFGFDLVSSVSPVYSVFLDRMSRLSILLAILSTPYVLYLLVRLKKYGWLLLFFILVVGPTLFSFWFLKRTDLTMITYYIALLFLVVYFFLLQNTYKDWREPVFLDKYTKGNN